MSDNFKVPSRINVAPPRYEVPMRGRRKDRTSPAQPRHTFRAPQNALDDMQAAADIIGISLSSFIKQASFEAANEILRLQHIHNSK